MTQPRAQLYSRLCSALLALTVLTLIACRWPTEPGALTRVPPATPSSSAAVLPTTPVRAEQPANKLGVHLLLDDGRNQWPMERWREHMHYARQATGAGGYVTELVRADDLNVERWQTFMDLCAELHLIPIIRLATTFDREAGWWRTPASDADGRYRAAAERYAAFLAALHWPTDQHYVMVGNEPNRGDEWGGRPNPVAYAQYLADVASAIHQRDPDALILNAGLDLFAPNSGSAPAFDGKYYMDAESFLDQMYTADPGVFTTIDRWSSHAYPLGPFSAPPWQQTFAIDLLNDARNPAHVEPPAGITNRGINGYEWELFKLATFGVAALPVMITETGWRHAETADLTATDGGTTLPSAESTAMFLDLALRGNHGRYPDLPENGWTPWLSDSRVVAVTPFAFNGAPSEWGHTNWLVLDEEGTVAGTYAAFERLATGNARPSNQPD